MKVEVSSMKKRLLLIIVLLFSTFIVTGCDTKTPLKPNDFVDLIEQNNYKTTNVKNQFSDYSQILNAFIAQDSEMRYQLEYYELDNEESAKSFYDGNKKVFQKMENIKSRSNVNQENYQKYSQSTETAYSVISRIDNTIIYANVKVEYKKEVNAIINKLGY